MRFGVERYRHDFPFRGHEQHRVPTRFVDPLNDADLQELNELLHWNCFTADARGRRFGAPAKPGKRDTPQPIPDSRIVQMHERFDLSDKHVLEVGSFEGIHTIALCGFARAVTAIDSRIENVVKTIVRCAFFGHHPTVFKHNVEETAFEPELLRADVVHHVGVLYHLREPVEHLLKLGRTTRLGIMLDTHYSRPEQANFTYDAGGRSWRYREFRESGHGNVFAGEYDHAKWLTLEGIEQALALAGFDKSEVVHTEEQRNGARVLMFAERSRA